ncbi:MAG TPA: PilZ domain-containing protein [Nevskia sp.]|nr:PilZ domain-containing protein [Rudaea sp.]HET7796580.1 PilZ domain-containing protein [Nevskia sp.]
MAEQRRSRRKKAPQTIPVTNSITGEAIGFVGNLSIDGMLLIANRALPDNALFQFTFELPGHGGSADRRLEIGVHEQWSEPASIPGQFWAGFRIIDIDPQDRIALGAWVNAQEDQIA